MGLADHPIEVGAVMALGALLQLGIYVCRHARVGVPDLGMTNLRSNSFASKAIEM